MRSSSRRWPHHLLQEFRTLSALGVPCVNPDIRNNAMPYAAITEHLAKVLGLQVQLSPWSGVGRLPQYLSERYDVAATSLLSTPCLLAIARGGHRSDTVRKDLQALSKLAPDGTLAIYVVDAIASYERRRLVEQSIPFLVPGNQLYLPDLGVDLREYFRRRRADAPSVLSPASQCLLLTTLLRPWREQHHPSDLAQTSDYSTATAWRATKEWAAAGFAEHVDDGRSRVVRFSHGPREVWAQSLPHLRSPVRAVYWAMGDSPQTAAAPLAGLSALAAGTALAAPAHPVRAISSGDWQLALDAGVTPVHGPDRDVTQYEVWRYPPRLFPDRPCVDPLSLILSLQECPDERVGHALQQLERDIPW